MYRMVQKPVNQKLRAMLTNGNVHTVFRQSIRMSVSHSCDLRIDRTGFRFEQFLSIQ
jgi:hypothetical protein